MAPPAVLDTWNVVGVVGDSTSESIGSGGTDWKLLGPMGASSVEAQLVCAAFF